MLQGDVRWADLPDPALSAAAYRRPVVVVQGDVFNRSRLGTVVCIPLTSNLQWAEAPGSVLLEAKVTGLPRDSVAQASQVLALDRAFLDRERAGRIGPDYLGLLFEALDLVLGR
ncbi:MAG: type II toxin-antitoxin system PemK/MazF family toxin [Myxococcales bacterium]|nr:type II toxin-antitoxin system PemK/MazF family toxin [Myxococcales bacterium]